MSTLQGQLLIASRRLTDSNFAWAVVLVVQHDEDGAMGLVINRPLDVRLRTVCEAATGRPCKRGGPVYHGGPCDGPLMAVHTQPAAAQVTVRRGDGPGDGLYFTAEKADLETLLDQAEGAGPAKFVAGYAGWSAGQLEAERDEGAWLLLPVRSADVFAADADELWPRLAREATVGRLVRDDLLPDDPSMN